MSSTQKYNILITGVAGLLGSRMADWIAQNTEHTIVGIDDLSGGYIENVNQNVQFHQLNLVTQKQELERLFSQYKFDYVYHFAAYAAEGLSPFIRSYNYQNNLVATAHIINNCITHDVKRLLFTSTMAVYGHGNPPFSEEHVPQPIDPYGIAKYACEMDIQVAGEQHGLDWCIIRPHNVYGVKQNIWDKYRNVLGIWMYQYMNGEPMTIFGDGEQTRSFSFIDDTLEPMWKALIEPQCSKQIINLGGTNHTSINEANKILMDVIGGGERKYLEDRHEVKQAVPTYQKSVELLGYEDKTSLYDGLKQMWEWAQTQPNRERLVWDNYEVEKGIYSFWKNKK
jgi:UDP-glucose 4-epimerase